MEQTVTKKQLEHIPGNWGLPIVGEFFKFVSDATGYYEQQRKKYGDVFRTNGPFGPQVILCGPTANKLILVEEDKFTSSKEAWEPSLKDLFPNGLMLMDGDQHKYHRGIMQEAFKKGPMQGYLDSMPSIIEKGMDELEGKKKILAFPFFKNLTLQLAAAIFFGLDSKDDLTEVNTALTNIVNGSAGVPLKIPFSKYQKGINGRKFLINYFKELLPERRANPGKDLFSRLCVAEDEAGNQFTDQEIIDHLIFVLMAAHDTTAITLTMTSYFLSKHPDWQDKLRAECNGFQLSQDTKVKDLRQLEKTGFMMKEVLRIHPPLIQVPRKLNKSIEVNGMVIPKNTKVNVIFQVSHNDERTWSNPLHLEQENTIVLVTNSQK